MSGEKSVKRYKVTDANKFTKERLDAVLGDARMPEEAPPTPVKKVRSNGVVANFVPRMRTTKDKLEYRRKQVLRLLLRGVPQLTIAGHLGVSLATVRMDVLEINKEMRGSVRNLDYPLFIGQTLAFFEEARNIALRIASDKDMKDIGSQIRALSTAIQAESEKHRYLEKVGLYNIPKPSEGFGIVGEGASSDGGDFADFMRTVRISQALPDVRE